MHPMDIAKIGTRSGFAGIGAPPVLGAGIGLGSSLHSWSRSLWAQVTSHSKVKMADESDDFRQE